MANEEIEPLLNDDQDVPILTIVTSDAVNEESGEAFDTVPKDKRQLGFTSTAFLITNRIIGTGIFATPSIIVKSAGSVGMTFTLWLLGALVAAAGTAVYIEFGAALPKSGGEKVYLEYLYRRPQVLMSCIYATWVLCMLSAGANSLVFSNYLWKAIGVTPNKWGIQLVAITCLTLATVVHAVRVNVGLMLQNIFGVCGLLSLGMIALSGLLVLSGVISPANNNAVPRNFASPWTGTTSDINSFVTGLFAVIWSFKGYNNANYALSETRNPVQTIKHAATTAVGIVATVYILVNVAYFAVVDKADIAASQQTVAALFIRNLYGEKAERLVGVIVACSTFGNILAILFAQSRIIQELARDDVIPLSTWLASNRPFNTPAAALIEQWLVAVLAVLLPAGDAYAFILNMATYPFNFANFAIAVGLWILHSPGRRRKLLGINEDWTPWFRAWDITIILYILANLFLLIAPLMPPSPGREPYSKLPYWSHSVSVLFLSGLGWAYWYIRFIQLPRAGNYKLMRVTTQMNDGTSRSIFKVST